MRLRYISSIAILFVCFTMFFTIDAGAQCKAFVKANCLPMLAPFVHDGSYQAVVMSEGEEAEIYKTIFAGQKYRLFICVDDNLPNVEFIVSDIHRNILFDSRKNGNVRKWDFSPDASQQIKVTIRIPKSSKVGDNEKELAFGCVAVLFGLMNK